MPGLFKNSAAAYVHDLILNPPTSAQYDTLKKQLVKRTAASEQHHLQQLFNSEKLGDRKPSQLLRRMQQLLGDKVASTDSSFLRELFLQRLPHNVRMILAGSGDDVNKDLDKLAALADKVLDVSTPLVSAVATSTAVEELRAEIAVLKTLVESQQKQSSQQPRQKTTPRSTHHSCNSSPARPATTQPKDNTLCWYQSIQGCCQEVSITMLLVGKRPGQALMATSDPGQLNNSHLFYLSDFFLGFRMTKWQKQSLTTGCKQFSHSYSLSKISYIKPWFTPFSLGIHPG